MKRRHNVIILDGPDGTGKTHIGKGLSSILGIPYFKFSQEHDYWRKNQFKTALEFDQTYLLQLLQQTKQNIIIDRAWPSEWVYSRVFKRETNSKLLVELDKEYAKLDARIIVPLRDDYSQNKKDEVVDKSHLQKIHDTYENFCDWATCRTIRLYVDSYSNELDSECEDIIDAICNKSRPRHVKLRNE